MQIFSRWPESQARLVRWVLLLGWLLLIVSLLFPVIALPEGLTPACADWMDSCMVHRQPGNRLFWGVVVPSGLMLIVLLMLMLVGDDAPGCKRRRHQACG